MSLLGWAIGLSIADSLLGDDDEEREEQKRKNEELRRRNELNEQRISRLEAELRDLKRKERGW